MQAPGNLDHPDAVAAHAARQAEAQAQVAMSDLGTAATRNSEAYMAQTDSRGYAVRANPIQDAHTVALVQHRRAQLQGSANAATAAWNSKQHPSFLSQSNCTDLSQTQT